MGSTWFDYNGETEFWRNIPLRTVKKALFHKGSMVRALAKMVLNGVTYNFKETAQGGAVIVPPGYSAIEFVSPDGRIDYNALLSGSLGNTFTASIEVLKVKPIPAWDKFAAWFGSQPQIGQISGEGVPCELRTLDGQFATAISMPNIKGVTDMVSLLEAVKTATVAAHSQPLAQYQLDDAAFGWVLRLGDSSDFMDVGFLFRE